MSIHTSIAGKLQEFGGHLECTVCGRKAPLGTIANKLAHGWPECCGYTMRWYTARELKGRSE